MRADELIRQMQAEREATIYVRVLEGPWEAVPLSRAEVADLQLARRRAWANYHATPRNKKTRDERDWLRSLAKAIEWELGQRRAGPTPPHGYNRPVAIKDPRTLKDVA